MRINSPQELVLLVINQRKKLKLSQATVADMGGLKQTTVSAFENNPASTKMDTLFRILSAMNLDIKISPQNTNNTKTEW